MYYPEDLVEEVRQRNDIVDVIGSYVRLQKKGSSHFGLCPFHNEKSPSFSVSGSKQMYYCFGCGEGGNVITFIMKYENYSFVEALGYLADRVGMELPKMEYSKEQKQQADEKAQLLQVQKDAATYYYKKLRSEEGRQALGYLTGRGLSEETIHRFGLGYSGKYSDGLYKYLKGKGYSDRTLTDSGLVIMDERRGPSDRFWNRVMFPIMDVNHRVVGFGGRVMGDAKPKYLNSPETKIFDKSRNLYGMNMARTSRKRGIILCEGYMDVIAMHQAGFTNAVASLGTAFTSGHASLVKRYAKEALLIYDSDEAGIKAALRAIPILNEAGLASKVVDLSPYKDPDEFIQNLGEEEFQKRLDQADNSFLFEVKVLKREYDMSDPRQKTEFYKEVAGKLLRFTESLERQNYTEAAANMLHISAKELQQLVNSEGIRRGGVTAVAKPKPTAFRKEKDEGILQAQRLLITWLIEEEGVYQKIKGILLPEDFTEGLYEEVVRQLYQQLEQGALQPAKIISHFQEEEQQRQVAALFNARLMEGTSKEEKEKALSEVIYKVKAHSFEKEKEQMNLADMNAMQMLIQKRQALDKLKRMNISLD